MNKDSPEFVEFNSSFERMISHTKGAMTSFQYAKADKDGEIEKIVFGVFPKGNLEELDRVLHEIRSKVEIFEKTGNENFKYE